MMVDPFEGSYPHAVAANEASTSSLPPARPDDWHVLFATCDSEGFGEVALDEFEHNLNMLLEEKRDQVAGVLSPDRLALLQCRLQHWRDSGVQTITTDSFVALMTRKRSLSFKRALHCRDGQMDTCGSENRARVSSTLSLPLLDFKSPDSSHSSSAWTPKTDIIGSNFSLCPHPGDRASSEHCLAIDDATALTPPKRHAVLVFPILSIGLIVAAYFLNDRPFWVQTLSFRTPTTIEESYEYVTYALVHNTSSCALQLAYNVVALILLGVRLEYEYGYGRPLFLFCSGILAGSIASKVFDSTATLQGASGGTFAIVVAYLMAVILKGSPSAKTHVQVISVTCFTSTELGTAIYRRYAGAERLSFAAHLAGVFIGMTTGTSLFIYNSQLKNNALWWVSVSLQASLLLLYCIIYVLGK